MSSDDPTGTDEAFRRLRAADPAAGSTPDLDMLRSAVTARVGDLEEDGPGRRERENTEHDDELLAKRNRRAAVGRGRRGLLVAASVAALAVFGGGGYAIGAASGTEPDGGSVVASDGSEDAAGGAVEQEALGRVADTMLAGYGRTEFTADGLSTQGSAAEAYGLDAGAALTAERVAQVAQALGLEGEPVLADGAWTVGSWDGGGPVLSVYVDGTASTSYTNPSLDPWRCAAIEQIEPDTGGGDTAAAECEGEQVAAGEDEAIAAAQAVVTAAGGDVGDYNWSITEPGEHATNVLATPNIGAGTVEGVIGWQFTVTTEGIASAWGSMAEVFSLGSYEVVSPAEAVQRLTDPRFGAGGGGIMPFSAAGSAVAEAPAGPVEDSGAGEPAPGTAAEETAPGTAQDPAQESAQESAPEAVEAPAGPADAPVDAAPPTEAPAPAEVGAPIDWPVRQVTINGSELVLMSVYSDDGAVVLVPAWRLFDTEGGVWTMNAVADAGLDFGAD
ncbi:hypothetical protein EXU48_12615 [Occultella glacieicola]|uniref:Uncharacterized protein n=1 Tax=Occultella glacieicola TaxID=2518684 RepID=A0ABY2E573_9MICO|nr:hypothetical protein [Occultella glacieicola]TDE94264.1 hypothetical protein EXU48_12615 [Occultella glacieicola]